jgi:hypothetical protein
MNRSKVNERLQMLLNAVQSEANITISEIEKDILLDELRRLYSELKGNHPLVSPAMITHQEVKSPVIENIPQTVVDEIVEEVVLPEEETTFQTQQVEIREEPIPTTAPTATPRITTTEVTTELTVKKKVTASINEQFTGSISELNRMHTKQVRELNATITPKDFKELIDLNKRFVIINTFFRGDADKFKSAIELINTSESLQQASAELCRITDGAYDPDSSSTENKMLTKLLKQKFGEV